MKLKEKVSDPLVNWGQSFDIPKRKKPQQERTGAMALPLTLRGNTVDIQSAVICWLCM